MIFDVILFPLAAFALFRDLSHKKGIINHTIQTTMFKAACIEISTETGADETFPSKL